MRIFILALLFIHSLAFAQSTMTLTVQQHTPNFATSPQLLPEQMKTAYEQGFRVIINNRPDGEGGAQQPTSAQIAAAAKAAGLDYHYIPVISGAMTSANVDQMAKLLPNLKGPVLAFCRSGARSTQLWQSAQ